MATVWCVRHGQSLANAGLPTESAEGNALTGIGQRQARCVAEAFSGPPDLVVVSPYRRTAATAAPLLARFPTVPAAVWPIEEFTYLAPARYRGTTRLDRSPDVAGYWTRLDPDFRDGEGAETFLEFVIRVEAFLARLRAMEGFVAVYTHGQFLRGVLLALLGGLAGGKAAAMARFRAFRQAFPVGNAAILALWLSDKETRFSALETGHLPDGLATE